MKIIFMVAGVLVTVIYIGSVMAVPPGKTIEWDNPAGKVIFDGKIHFDKGLKCNDCHTKVFAMKKGTAEMSMKELEAGAFCGTCHNGTSAFKTSDPESCARCHIK
jgi:c(7)-type cytochrome triheme protein